jgi:hypothetical protein
MDIKTEKSDLLSLSELFKPMDEKVSSDDLSMSQLEILANKKKLIKQTNEIPVSEFLESKHSIKSVKSSVKNNSVSSKKSSTMMSSSVSSEPRKYEKEPKRIGKKQIEAENENPGLRRDKSEIISKINKLNNDTGNKFAGFLVNMDVSLYDLRNELQRLETEVSNDQKVKMLRTGLSFTVQGLEWLNTAYDPMGVDLIGWTNNLNIQLDTKQYDKILMEIYEKYFTGDSTLPPELKLLAMLLISGTGYAVTKKMQNSAQAKLEKMMDDMRKPSRPAATIQETIETLDDPLPSKMQSPDSTDLKNILLKMQENKQKTIDDIMEEVSSEEIFKNIDMSKKKSTRGRKKKV